VLADLLGAGGASPFQIKFQILMEEGKKEEAHQVLVRYSELNGRDYQAHRLLAANYRERKDIDRERRHLELMRDIDPYDRALHVRLAEISTAARRHGDAVSALRIALAIPPELDRSARDQQEGQASLPTEGPLWLQLCEALIRAGQPQEAAKEAGKLLAAGKELSAEQKSRAEEIAKGG
jgi:predicted Zn-dependent protease